MPNLTVKDFGIELKPGTDEATALRLLTGQYTGSLTEKGQQRAEDTKAMLAAGEDWAAMYATWGYQDTSKVGEPITNDEKVIANGLYVSCAYYTADDARLKSLQEAEKTFAGKVKAMTTPANEMEMIGVVSVMTRIMRQMLPVFPKLNKEVAHTYIEEQSSASRSHSHKSDIYDAKASIESVQRGLHNVAPEVVSTIKLK